MKTRKMQKRADILHRIAEASDAIRHKHEIIKHGRKITQRAMNELFKLVVTPLKQLVDQTPIRTEEFNVKKNVLIKKDPTEGATSFQTTHDNNTVDYDVDNSAISDDESFTTAPHQSTPIKELPAVSYLKKFDSKHQVKELDTKFGVRKLKNKLMIGNAEARFDDKFVYIDNNSRLCIQGPIREIIVSCR